MKNNSYLLKSSVVYFLLFIIVILISGYSKLSFLGLLYAYPSIISSSTIYLLSNINHNIKISFKQYLILTVLCYIPIINLVMFAMCLFKVLK